MQITFKKNFIERYKKLTNWEVFKKTCTKKLKRSIRVNTLKISREKLIPKLQKKDYKLIQIPFCKQGYYIEGKRPDIGNLQEHTLGYFYVQEAASMIPPLVLNPKKHEFILDLAAAPGSKTTQISALMENTGIIIANDYKYQRLKPLSINTQRCGCKNIILTISHGHRIKNMHFDKILLDAPCSGTGSIAKSLKTLQIYNTDMIKKLAGEQKRLILNAYSLLKKDGTLVYSTCSLEPHENEAVIDYLLKKTDAKLEKIEIKNLKRSEPILEFEKESYSKEIKKCLRIWPQDNNTEGFFIAKIIKTHQDGNL